MSRRQTVPAKSRVRSAAPDAPGRDRLVQRGGPCLVELVEHAPERRDDQVRRPGVQAGEGKEELPAALLERVDHRDRVEALQVPGVGHERVGLRGRDVRPGARAAHPACGDGLEGDVRRRVLAGDEPLCPGRTVHGRGRRLRGTEEGRPDRRLLEAEQVDVRSRVVEPDQSRGDGRRAGWRVHVRPILGAGEALSGVAWAVGLGAYSPASVRRPGGGRAPYCAMTAEAAMLPIRPASARSRPAARAASTPAA